MYWPSFSFFTSGIKPLHALNSVLYSWVVITCKHQLTFGLFVRLRGSTRASESLLHNRLKVERSKPALLDRQSACLLYVKNFNVPVFFILFEEIIWGPFFFFFFNGKKNPFLHSLLMEAPTCTQSALWKIFPQILHHIFNLILVKTWYYCCYLWRLMSLAMLA